jgi:hypothetical protein
MSNFLKTVHVTAQGERMLITQMETRHLLNTIRSNMRKIASVTSISQEKDDVYRSTLYGKKSISPKDAAELVNEGIEGSAQYFVECFFRMGEVFANPGYLDIYNEIQQLMATVYLREGVLEKFNIPMLNARVFDHSGDREPWNFDGDDNDHVPD